jgi:acetylglutamate kinase
MINEELKSSVMRDLVLLQLVGIKVVLVHGGGPEISAMLKRVGIESKFVNGLRYTDAETAEIVRMVLAGKINKSLVGQIEACGGKAIGLCGIDGGMLTCEKENEDLGFVGKIVHADTKVILDCLASGYIPVISTVGYDQEGNVYNVNADTAAARIAGELKAERLITMTDIEGVLRDKNDHTSLIPCIDLQEAAELFESGIISGGMIPKVECCIDAIRMGAKKVTILDGRVPHALLIETMTDEGAGTMFVREKKDADEF